MRSTPQPDDAAQMAQRYARREARQGLYSWQRPEVLHMVHERQRALVQLLLAQGLTDWAALRVVEVGCGAGGNLLELLRLGFAPQHLSGIELLADRAAQAREVLPQAVAVVHGDAAQQPLPPGSVDVVLQSTVLSSVLADESQQALADAAWRWLRPGGGVLWYDLRVNNPRNPDVRGIGARRLRQLFPDARIQACRVTLAPPLARAACRLHPGLYPWLNAWPWLRTHTLAWIGKPM
jgi:SAM-dependent methyltransferase